MRKILLIESPAGVQLAVARTTLAGGAAALLRTVGLAPPLWALLGTLLLGAALLPPRRLRQALWLLPCAVAAGLLGVLGAGAGALYPSVGVALGLCLWLTGVPAPLPRWQRALAGVGGALLVLGGAGVARALAAWPLLEDLPGAAGPLLAGLCGGLVLGGAALVRQLRLHEDPLDEELRALLPGPGAVMAPQGKEESDEIAKLVQEAARSYQESAEALREHRPALQAAEELVKKIARFGRRWREIEAQARRSDAAALAARLGELQARQGAATDAEAGAEYQRACAAVEAQLQALGDIAAGRERAVARLHHQVATLERLRLTALRHRSVDASRQGEELRAVIDDLNRAGEDMDTAAEALAEVPV